MLENVSFGAQLVQEFGLDKPPHRLTAETLVKRCIRLEEVRGADVIRLKVRLPDPDLAARVANRLMALGIELNQRINRVEVDSSRSLIKSEAEKARQQVKDVQERLLAFKEKAQIDLARKDIESKLGQRGQLLGLRVEIEAEAARLAKAEEELAKQEKFLTVRRSIDEDPVLTEAARTAGRAGTSLAGLQLRAELVNQVYEELARQVAASRTKLSALQRQRAELDGTLKLGASEVPGLAQLYKKESELAKLELEHDLAKKVYYDLIVRFEQANQVGRGTELQVVEEALAPSQPVSPRPLFYLTLGLVSGLVLSIVVALLLDYASRAGASGGVAAR
jgi:uncharacterized protein involved in exopolysaccharide biosynthesis